MCCILCELDLFYCDRRLSFLSSGLNGQIALFLSPVSQIISLDVMQRIK